MSGKAMNVFYGKFSNAHLVVTLRVFHPVSKQTLLTQLRHGDSTCRFQSGSLLSKGRGGLQYRWVASTHSRKQSERRKEKVIGENLSPYKRLKEDILPMKTL